MGYQSSLQFRIAALSISLLFGMTVIGCHQLTPQPVATFSQPPTYPYPSATPSYVTPTPDPSYGTPTPADSPYGAARPITPTIPESAQPSLSGRPVESYNRRVPTPVDPPTESQPSESFVGPVLTPPTDLPDSAADTDTANSFLDSLGSTAPQEQSNRTPAEQKTKPADLELSVRVSANHRVGAAIEYKLAIENIGGRLASEVTIEAEFDDALIFPGRSDKRVRKVLGDFSGGQSQEIPLTLTSDESGVHCARFTLSGTDLTPVTKQVCVTISEQATARFP